MDEIGPLWARLGRLRRKARYYDRVRLRLHLDAARAMIDELEARLAELERTPGQPKRHDPAAADPRLPDGHPPPPADPAAACGFS
jgi:hypothetical protein